MTDTGEPPGGPNLNPMRFIGIGFELIAPVLAGMFIGYKLDAWLGTKPWLFLLLVLMGIAAGYLNFFRQVLPSRKNRRTDNDGT